MKSKTNAKVVGLIAGVAMVIAAAPASFAMGSSMKSVDDLLKAVDANNDGMIQRSEYVEWCAHKASMDFDKWSGGASMMTAKSAFDAYKQWSAITGG